MLPTITPAAAPFQTKPRAAAFRAAFLGHIGTAWARVATTKTVPSQRISSADLPDFEFFTPSRSVGSALIVDIDRPEAVTEVFDALPTEARPSWIVETPKGAQAGWFIDPVDLRPTARAKPVAYARAVGAALRAALEGDEAVDPLTPARVRNPAYIRADLRAAAAPPVYRLKQLHQVLDHAGLWPSAPVFGQGSFRRAIARNSVEAMAIGNRNQTVFDIARHAAYAGDDHAAVAIATNDAAAEPLSATEVNGIIRSITRYMSTHRARARTAMPSQMRELLAEMGKRGGSANTPAQQAARAKSCVLATAARKAAADTKARQAQKMRARGHTAAHIARKLHASRQHIYRWLRRYVGHHTPVAFPEHQVIRSPRSKRKGSTSGSTRCTLVTGQSTCRPPSLPDDTSPSPTTGTGP